MLSWLENLLRNKSNIDLLLQKEALLSKIYYDTFDLSTVKGKDLLQIKRSTTQRIDINQFFFAGHNFRVFIGYSSAVHMKNFRISPTQSVSEIKELPIHQIFLGNLRKYNILVFFTANPNLLMDLLRSILVNMKINSSFHNQVANKHNNCSAKSQE
jgi:hypothetical protein